MGRFAKALVVVVVLLGATYAAYRYAWYSGPYLPDRCESSQKLRLDTFLPQIEPFLQRFHLERVGFDPADLRGYFSARATGKTDLYGSADMVFVL